MDILNSSIMLNFLLLIILLLLIINLSNRKYESMVPYVSDRSVLGSNMNLWNLFKNYYGHDKASIIMPPSYILPNDRKLFDHDYKKNKLYALESKNNIALAGRYWDVINYHDAGYKVIQEFEKHPLLFQNRKLNFKIYLLVVCENNNKSVYINPRKFI